MEMSCAPRIARLAALGAACGATLLLGGAALRDAAAPFSLHVLFLTVAFALCATEGVLSYWAADAKVRAASLAPLRAAAGWTHHPSPVCPSAAPRLRLRAAVPAHQTALC